MPSGGRDDAKKREGAVMKVEDVMTTDVRTIAPGATLKTVANVLTEARISGLPVVGTSGEVLGVVSEGDILSKERGLDDKPSGIAGWFFLEPPEVREKVAARLAGEAMSSPAITIEPWQPLQRAAALMIDHQVNRLPVVDESGKLVGIVTRKDLVRAFVRSDAEIRREILDDVILHSLWIAPERVVVKVEDGEVTIGGQVDTPLDAELVRRLVERIPGIVSVQSDLACQIGHGTDRHSKLPIRT
jgi:CBS-domain-containing membrane protein